MPEDLRSPDSLAIHMKGPEFQVVLCSEPARVVSRRACADRESRLWQQHHSVHWWNDRLGSGAPDDIQFLKFVKTEAIREGGLFCAVSYGRVTGES